MRSYRLEIRLIQTAVVLSGLILISGFLGAGIWGESAKPQTGGTTPTTGETQPQAQTPVNPKIVAIGDSFTYGYPSDPDHSWTTQLGDNLTVPVVNKGIIHQNANDLLSRFDQDVISEQPGRVIIFAGTGDALQNISLIEYQSNIQAMVDKANANHIEPILALPMPYPGAQDRIDELKAWELEYAQAHQIMTLDFSSVLFGPDGKYLPGLSDDGKYPTADGYVVMGDYAARVLQ